MTNREAVRLTIADTAGTIFTNDEVDWFLSKEGDNTDLASARALEAIAASAALLEKAQSSGQFSTDKKGLASALLETAARLRANVDDVEGGVNAPAWSMAELRWEPTETDYTDA